MKIISKPKPAYLGWWVICQCGGVSELTEAGDLQVHERGDYKDESTLKFICLVCGGTNYSTFSRLKERSTMLKASGVQ